MNSKQIQVLNTKFQPSQSVDLGGTVIKAMPLPFNFIKTDAEILGYLDGCGFIEGLDYEVVGCEVLITPQAVVNLLNSSQYYKNLPNYALFIEYFESLIRYDDRDKRRRVLRYLATKEDE